MGWRDYDPSTGRFIVPDEYEGEEDEPTSLNRYLNADRQWLFEKQEKMRRFFEMKLSMIFGSIVIVMFMGVVSYIFFLGNQKDMSKEFTVKMSKEERKAQDGGKLLIMAEKTADIEEAFPMDMTEQTMQNTIHSMSHQKVVADKKWGAIPLTAERVERLLLIVKTNRDDYKHHSIYEEILIKWSNNNFSEVDKDHNAIWTLQNGNIGKATGVLSKEEEAAFVKKHFNIDLE